MLGHQVCDFHSWWVILSSPGSDKDTQRTVTHDRAENPVFGSETFGTAKHSWHVAYFTYVAGMRARARSRLRGGKVSDRKSDINYYRFSLSISRTRMRSTSRDGRWVITPSIVASSSGLLLSPLSIDQTRSRKPPAASRVNLVPEELHDVRGRCADAPVSDNLLLDAERVVTKSPSDKSVRRIN